MMRPWRNRQAALRWAWPGAALLGTILGTAPGQAEPVPAPAPAGPAHGGSPEQPPPVLSLADAIRWGIEHNPGLATIRRQRGIAAAGVVIADTYPFNPIMQDFVMGASGPSEAGITNRVFNEHTMRLDLEIRGQGKYRRGAARAALSRTDWEIAAQEILVAVQVVRAFNTALYRREKLRVLEETVRLQEQVVEQVNRLVEQGQLPRTELMLARTDLADARAAVGPARNVLTVAVNDLSRLLGVVDGHYELQGQLETILPAFEEAGLVRAAEERRPDLHALELAVKEAQARVGLEVANRYGNPSIGPAFEYNETSVSFIGMWLVWQVPVLNVRKGEIMQRQAERARAVQAVDSLLVTLRQDVRAALSRLASAKEAADVFRTQTIPTLQSTRAGIDQLFTRGEPGVTLARVIAIRTRLLQAYSAYLDTLFELTQAQADLAAAVGDPSLALVPPAPPPAAAPPPKK